MTTITDLDASDDEEFWIEVQRAMKARAFDLFLSDQIVDRTFETLKVEIEVIQSQIDDRTDEEWRKRAIGYKGVLVRHLALARNRVKEMNRAEFPAKLAEERDRLLLVAAELGEALRESSHPILDDLMLGERTVREWLKLRRARQREAAARAELAAEVEA